MSDTKTLAQDTATRLADLPPGSLFVTREGRVGWLWLHSGRAAMADWVGRQAGEVLVGVSSDTPVRHVPPDDLLEALALLDDMRAGTDAYVERACAQARAAGRREGLEEAAKIAERKSEIPLLSAWPSAIAAVIRQHAATTPQTSDSVQEKQA